MFRIVYESAAAFLLLQGIAIPVLLLLSGWWWRRHPQEDAATSSPRFARWLGNPFVRALFIAMIFVEPLLFVLVLIGSNLYPDTWIDRLITALGPGAGMLAGGFILPGFFVWMILYVMLAGLSRDFAGNPAPERAAKAFGDFVATVCVGLGVLTTSVLVAVGWKLIDL